MAAADETVSERLGIAFGRAAAGALIFGIPMLMTMEMWGLGFYMDRLKLLLMLAISLQFLTGLSYYSGFEPTFKWRSEEHTSELQSLMSNSYAVFCLQKKKT